MPTFTSTPFTLESLAQNSASVLRLRYSSAPLATNVDGMNDATNISNYGVEGPVTNFITGVAAVADDPQAVDITFFGPLATGTWTVNVYNVQTVAAEALTSPTALSCACVESSRINPVNGGKVDFEAYDVLRAHLSPAIAGKNVDGILEGLAAGDQTNIDNAKLALLQLFKASASGIYLERQASAEGIYSPPALGMSDENLRKWLVRASTSKVTTDSILQVLEVFYGSDSVRANIVSGNAQPYNMPDGVTLSLLIDGKTTINVVFPQTGFIVNTQASAQEIAVIITRACINAGSNAYAIPFTDPTTGNTVVKLYSGSLGLGSTIVVTGGTAQVQLAFPTVLSSVYGTFSAITWSVTASLGVAQFSTASASSVIDLSQLRIGDYVVIGGFADTYNGSFPITDLYIVQGQQWFTIDNPVATTNTLTQNTQEQLSFYRPTKAGLYAMSNRTVVVSQPKTGGLNITIPATSPIVNRAENTGAYAQVQPSYPFNLVLRDGTGLVYLESSESVPLNVGDHFTIDNTAVGNNSAPFFEDYEFGSSGGWDNSNYSMCATWSPVRPSDINQVASGGLLTLHSGDAFTFMGVDSSGVPTAQCERLTTRTTVELGNFSDVGTKWVPCASAPAGRWLFASCLTADGRVYVSGGLDSSSAQTTTTFLYDSEADSWYTGTALPIASSIHVATGLSNNSVFVAGLSSSNQTYLYSPDTDTYTTNVVLPFPTKSPYTTAPYTIKYMTQLPDGTVFVLTETPFVNCFVVDTVGMTVKQVGNPTYTGYNHFCTLINGIVVAGGGSGHKLTKSGSNLPLNKVEGYDYRTSTWFSMSNMLSAHPTGSFVSFQPPVGTSWPSEVIVCSGTAAVPPEYYDCDKKRWYMTPPFIVVPSVSSQSVVGCLLQGLYPFFITNDSGVSYGGEIFIPNTAPTYNGKAIDGNGVVIVVLSPGTFFLCEMDNGACGPCFSGASLLTPVASLPGAFPGPYVLADYCSVTSELGLDEYRPGPALTGIESTTINDIVAGIAYKSIPLNTETAFNFPNTPGYVCFDIGGKYETYPVHYLGWFSGSPNPALLLDMGTTFSKTIPAGSKVTLLAGNDTFENPNQVGPFYITASSSARVTAQAAVESMLAGGIPVNMTISYPGDRGLGGEGKPAKNAAKLSDKTEVWGGDNLDTEIPDLRKGVL